MASFLKVPQDVKKVPEPEGADHTQNAKGDADLDVKHCQGRLALNQGTLPQAEEPEGVSWSP